MSMVVLLFGRFTLTKIRGSTSPLCRGSVAQDFSKEKKINYVVLACPATLLLISSVKACSMKSPHFVE